MPPASAPIEITLDMVSFHAVTRYIQRVLGLTVPGMENDMGRASKVALAHCALAGMSFDAVRTRILTRAVRCGLQEGAPRVLATHFVIELGHTPPTVMTILPAKPEPKAPASQSRAQARRNILRYERRQRDRQRSLGLLV